MMKKSQVTVGGKKEKLMGWVYVIWWSKTDVERLCLKAFWSREN